MFDMFGIRFDGHPDLTRILMPEDWVGHPLRKDYAVGRIPVQFKGAPREPPMTAPTRPIDRTRHVERAPTLRRRPHRPRAARRCGPAASSARDELLREVGSVLRMTEAEAAALSSRQVDPADDETMIINMGPQHPSTHGVLRLMLELQGETVLRTKPIIGYLHTGMEKTGEELTYLQGPHQRHPHGLRVAALQRAGVRAGDREAARHRRTSPSGRSGSACS